MSTRTYIAALISMMVNAVILGAGAITVLSITALSAHAAYLLPIVVALSFVVSPSIAWAMAPMLRSRWQREHERPLAMRG